MRRLVVASLSGAGGVAVVRRRGRAVAMADMEELFGSDADSEAEQKGAGRRAPVLPSLRARCGPALRRPVPQPRGETEGRAPRGMERGGLRGSGPGPGLLRTPAPPPGTQSAGRCAAGQSGPGVRGLAG